MRAFGVDKRYHATAIIHVIIIVKWLVVILLAAPNVHTGPAICSLSFLPQGL
jgi:hypothetical protein